MKWLLKLYPQKWRERYEDEFLYVLEQMNSHSVSYFLDVCKLLILTWFQELIEFRKTYLPSKWLILLFVFPIVLLAFNQEMYLDWIEVCIIGCASLLLFACLIMSKGSRLTKFLLVIFIGTFYMMGLISVDLILDYFIYGRHAAIYSDGASLTLYQIFSEFNDDIFLLIMYGLSIGISFFVTENVIRQLVNPAKETR